MKFKIGHGVYSETVVTSMMPFHQETLLPRQL